MAPQEGAFNQRQLDRDQPFYIKNVLVCLSIPWISLLFKCPMHYDRNFMVCVGHKLQYKYNELYQTNILPQNMDNSEVSRIDSNNYYQLDGPVQIAQLPLL